MGNYLKLYRCDQLSHWYFLFGHHASRKAVGWNLKRILSSLQLNISSSSSLFRNRLFGFNITFQSTFSENLTQVKYCLIITVSFGTLVGPLGFLKFLSRFLVYSHAEATILPLKQQAQAISKPDFFLWSMRKYFEAHIHALALSQKDKSMINLNIWIVQPAS